jgi:hypothetical protein
MVVAFPAYLSPNLSIERTSPSQLRRLAAAAHLKRYARKDPV